jgi:hypothetical protein
MGSRQRKKTELDANIPLLPYVSLAVWPLGLYYGDQKEQDNKLS